VARDRREIAETRGLLLQPGNVEPAGDRYPDRPVGQHELAEVVQAVARGVEHAGDVLLQLLAVGLVETVVQANAVPGDDRRHALRVVGVLLAGDVRGGLHQADALLAVGVAAVGEVDLVEQVEVRFRGHGDVRSQRVGSWVFVICAGGKSPRAWKRQRPMSRASKVPPAMIRTASCRRVTRGPVGSG